MLSGAKAILLNNHLGAEYTRVLFAQSLSGGGYVNTGITFGAEKIFKVRFSLDYISGSDQYVFGSRTTTLSDWFGVKVSGRYINLDYGSQSLWLYTNTVANTIYDVIIPWNGHPEVWSNGQLLKQNAAIISSEISNDIPIYLFAYNTPASPLLSDGVRLHSLSCETTAGDKIAEFIPYVDSEKNVCFYNKSNDTIELPSSTSFRAGPSSDIAGNLLINKDTQIPVSYTLCDYLESTGTQYIDTGYIPSNNSGLHGKYSYGANGSTTTFCGLHTDDWVFSLPNSQGTLRKGFERAMEAITTTIGEDVFVDALVNINSRSIVTTSETSAFDFDGSYLFTASYTLPLFSNRDGANLYEKGNMKGYLLEIYESDLLVHQYIPCLDTNGIPCFFDTVTGETLYNAGTGEFLYQITDLGKVLPSEYVRLDYAASMGTASVKTDYILNDVNIDITAQAIYKRNDNYLFGNYNYTGGKNYHTTYYDNRWYGGIGGAQINVAPEISCLEKHTISASPSAGYFIDGVQKVAAYGTCTIPSNMLLFSRYNGVSTVQYGYWKIFDCTLTSSTTSSHIVPVKKRNRVLMYDIDAKKELNPTNNLYGGPEIDLLGNIKLNNLSRIPTSYTELEWIESDGTPYIQTDIIPLSSYSYDTIVSTRSDSATGTVFWGSRGADDSTSCYLSSKKGESIKFVTSLTDHYDTGTVGVVDALNLFEGMTTSTDHASSTQPISLFAFNKNGTIDKAVGKVKIALLRVKDTAEHDRIVNELIPCLDSTGIPCFYDTITTNTYYNIGGGTFSYKRKTIHSVTSTAGEYVQDGLIAMWDGIENFGYGLHDKESKIWKNLGSLGGYFNATRSLVNTKNNAQTSKYGDNRYIWSTRTAAIQRDYLKSEYTYEIVFTPSKDFTRTYSSLLGYYGSGVGIRGYEIVDSGANVIMGVDTNFNVNYMSRSIIDHEVPQTMTMVASLSAGKHTVYKNTFQNGWKSVNANHTLTNAAAMIIGADRNESGRTFAGDIHCVRIYNRPLTQDEIRQNFKVDKKRFKFTDFILPDGLTRVEYLQNTVHNYNGTATEYHSYFDIPKDLIDMSNFEMKVMFEPVELLSSSGSETLVIRDHDAWDGVRKTGIMRDGTNTARMVIHHNRQANSGTGISTASLVGNTFCITTRNSNALINGTSYGIAAPSGTENLKPFRIFSHGISKFYYVTFYNADKKPVMNIIPVRNGDVGCLYDTINATIYENLGDTPYACGPDVV